MATIGNTYLTLADHAKREDPDGKVAKVVEILSQSNEILTDMAWIEGNLTTGHKTTIRTGLPSATWRLINQGVGKTKSTTTQATDTCGMLEIYSEIDVALANLNGNTAEFRLSEDRAFLEGMNQQMATALFYSSQTTNPERITGLATRYASLSAGNAANIIDAGGTGTDNTSIYMVVWGDNTCHGIYPKGSKAGIQHNDKGQVTGLDASNNNIEVYRTHYKWDCGLSLRDWRYVVRICNIDVSDLAGGSPANLINLLIRASHKLPSMSMGRPAIYCNRAVATWLDIQALNKANVNLRYAEVFGEEVLTFRKMPIRICDAILNTEARVT